MTDLQSCMSNYVKNWSEGQEWGGEQIRARFCDKQKNRSSTEMASLGL